MIKFSKLLDDLLLNSSKKKKIKILKDYFNSLETNEKELALSILSKNFSTKLIKANDIKIMIKRKISEDSELLEDLKRLDKVTSCTPIELRNRQREKQATLSCC